MTLPEGAQTSTFLDRSHWGSGPWDNEPDRVAWKEQGLHCLIKRGPMGAWCGYVAVPPGHPWHGVDDCELSVAVHGGLTYSNHCVGNEETGICHKPDPGEPDAVWWLGFDCFHWNDAAPALEYTRQLGTYRTAEYTAAQVRRLADQAIEAECLS